MASPRDLLILRHQDFRSDVSSFFKDLNEDRDLRNLFFTNPSLVLRSKFPSLSPMNITDDQDQLANRILFSALSNEKFMGFLKQYQKKKNEALARLLKAPDDEEAATALDERTIRMEFAEALLEFGDKELLSNLLGRSDSITQAGRSLGWFLIFILVFIVIVVVHTIFVLGTSHDFAPTFAGKIPISAAELRKLSAQLVAAAKQARDAGELTP